MTTPVQIKICGVTNVKDARACADLGVSMIGFNFYLQSSRYVEPKVEAAGMTYDISEAKAILSVSQSRRRRA